MISPTLKNTLVALVVTSMAIPLHSETPKVPSAKKIPKVTEVKKVPKEPEVPEAPKTPTTPTKAVIPSPKAVPKISEQKNVKVPKVKVPKTAEVKEVKAPQKVAKTDSAQKKSKEPTAPKSAGKNTKKTATTAKVAPAKDKNLQVSETVKAKVQKPVDASLENVAVEDAKANNPKQPPKGGPEADIPGIERPSKPSKDEDQTPPRLAQPAPLESEGDSITNLTSPAQSLRKDVNANLLDDTNNTRPAFDQGFEKKTLDGAAAEAAQANSGNPVNGLTGGSVGGPVGDAANSSGTGSTGIAGQGIGAISDGGPLTSGGSAVFEDGEVRGRGGEAALDKAADLTGKSKAEVNKVVTDALGLTGNSIRAQMLEASKDDGTSTPAAAAPAAATDTSNIRVSQVDNSTRVTNANGDRVITNDATGNTTTIRPDGSAQTRTKDGKVEELPAGTVAPTTPPPAPAPTTTSPLRGEDRRDPAAIARFRRENPAVAEQIRQSKSGGSGDVDPNRAGDNFTRGNAAPPPSTSVQQQNLVGQPGQAGGLGESGAPKTGLDFNGNAGAIDLGPDSTVTAGNRQQDPKDVFNNAPRRSLSDARSTPTPTPAKVFTPKKN